tara:strand:+ start:486 stop:668 length:183 start_codon:yes stop_codon:yes gene_type:complete
LKNNYLKLLKIKARNFLNVSKKSGFVRLELGVRGFSKKNAQVFAGFVRLDKNHSTIFVYF